MNGMRSKSNRNSDTTSLEALNRTIEGLEARIDGLISASAARSTTNRQTDNAQRSAEPKREAARFDPIAEIRRRQQALEDSRHISQPVSSARATINPPESQYYTQRREAAQQVDLAQALSALRSELKSDLTDSMSREMQSLRSEMNAMRVSAELHSYSGNEIADELLRLQNSIERMSSIRNPEADRLRMDVEELRLSLDQMAREDSFQRLERRWDGIENHIRSNVDTSALQDEIVALAYRLDDIKNQLGAVNDSPAIRTVEKKLITLAELVEKLGHHMQPNDAALFDQFQVLDQRLDEISRAIAAASNRPLTQNIDNAVAHRIEARLNALSDNLDSLSKAAVAKPTSDNDFNQRSISQLEERLEQLSQLVERSQASNAHPEINAYFSDLSSKIDALDAGSASDALNERLEQLSRQIEQIDARSSEPQSSTLYDNAFLRLEERLSDIAARLDESTYSGSSDNDALLSLEGQISHLSQLISQPSYQDPGSMTAQLDTRMSAIEQHLTTNDEYIIEVARQAAEAVLDAYTRNNYQNSASSSDMQMLNGLAKDLRNLETLTKNNDERTVKTFEALHDTLVQIAGRLDTLDSRTVEASSARAPSHPQESEHESLFRHSEKLSNSTAHNVLQDPVVKADATQADAGVSAAIDAFLDERHSNHRENNTDSEKRGLIKSLTKRFRNNEVQEQLAPQTRVKIDNAPSLDPTDALSSDNELLEPGSGQPDIKEILERVRATQAGHPRRQPITAESRADIIAAARRAAQAAADESHKANAEGSLDYDQTKSPKGSRFRRPLLLGIGAVLLALLTLPVVKTINNNYFKHDTAIELNAPLQRDVAPATETSAVAIEGTVDAPAQAAANAMEKQAQVTAPKIDNRVIGGASLGEETLGSGNTVDALDRAIDSVETASIPALQVPTISVPAAIAPASLADAASSGNPDALFEIASRYIEGRSGVEEDLAEAARWYKLAADKGHAVSQYRLASMYEKANGVEQDLNAAQRYYLSAAQQGNAGAMHNLAVMLTTNALGEPDFTKAAEWFTKAANHGVNDSQYNLAILYARGSGVKNDMEEAYKWFAIAARGGDSDAADKRDQIEQALSPSALSSAKAKLASWTVTPLNDETNSVNLPDAWVDASPAPTATFDMEKAIRNIQAILNKNGFNAGNADGKLGPSTLTAIKEFQQSVGLNPSGHINDELITALLERNK